MGKFGFVVADLTNEDYTSGGEDDGKEVTSTVTDSDSLTSDLQTPKKRRRIQVPGEWTTFSRIAKFQFSLYVIFWKFSFIVTDSDDELPGDEDPDYNPDEEDTDEEEILPLEEIEHEATALTDIEGIQGSLENSNEAGIQTTQGDENLISPTPDVIPEVNIQLNRN